jgi:hypothetical protein
VCRLLDFRVSSGTRLLERTLMGEFKALVTPNLQTRAIMANELK